MSAKTKMSNPIKELPTVGDAFPNFDHGQEVKEAVCDALINAIAAKASGFGTFGGVVLGKRPRDQFTSGFLLNQQSSSGADETSDIRIAVHGANVKLRCGVGGELTVQPHFCAYIRLLPTWEDLDNPLFGLRPQPRLLKDIRKAINAEAALQTDAKRSAGDSRSRRVIFQEIVRELMTERGVVFRKAGVSVLALKDEEEPAERDQAHPAEGISNNQAQIEGGEDARETPIAVAESVDGAEYPDNLCSDEEIPLKFKRLSVEAPKFVIELSASDEVREQAIREYADGLRRAVEQSYDAFIVSPEGKDWCWRDVSFKPSFFRSRQAWENALTRLRSTGPRKEKLWPALQPELSIEWATSPAEQGVIHAAIGLLHRSVNKVGESEGDGGLYQVALSISVPEAALVPYVLERVKPAYDIHGFHTVPAAGWNSGVVGETRNSEVLLRTTWAPRYTLPRIVPNQIKDLDISFSKLADSKQSLAQLDRIADEFDRWIASQRETIDPTAGVDKDDPGASQREIEKFQKDLVSYEEEVRELRVGVALLKESQAAWQKNAGDPTAIPFRAWLLMNRAFQKSGARENKTAWRLFQIAFVIANIVSPATRMPEFAHFYAPNVAAIESASLLYFATGGGKSEAFFGLLLYTLFLDRMRGKLRGVSALIRYPLRLLTAQQARRLARILAQAEIIRRDEGIPGAAFEIGFWVGSGSTPNRITKGDNEILEAFECIPTINSPEHRREVQNLDDGAYSAALRDYNKLPKCPFCNSDTVLRRYPAEHQRLGVVCLSASCEWNQRTKGTVERPLPFLLVDHDIYRAAPAVLLGTIDKLALIGQHWSTINRLAGVFGLARFVDSNGLLHSPVDLDVEKKAGGNQRVAPSFSDGVELFVDPMPALIIQDEAHLLEESLGTFAGLFETTLYHWFRSLAPILGNRVARVPSAPSEIRLPKVITATATISDPQRQIRVLYQKNVRQFPNKGPRLYRSFYANPSRFTSVAQERMEPLSKPRHEEKDVEMYSPWARVYVSLLTNGRPHTTASVMVLGAFTAIITHLMRDLCSGDLERQVAAVAFLKSHTSAGSLAARHTAALTALNEAGRYDALAAAIDLHRVALTYVTNKKGGDQILSALPGIASKQHDDFGSDAIVDEVPMELISGGVESGTVESIVRRAEKQYCPGDGDIQNALRMIVATSAVSHGVDVENFNSMFFAGMPTAIDEYIQASSRIGRIHVGFSMLIPTPQNRRDRFILEVHESFHRFLERMIAPPAIERWADRAILRIIPSLIQNWLVGKVYQEVFAADPDPTKKRVRIFSKVSYVRSLVNRMGETAFVDTLLQYILACIGADAEHGGAHAQRQIVETLIRDRLREFVLLLETPLADGDLSSFWDRYQPNIEAPMLSLRDVDAPGTIRPLVTSRKTNAKERFAATMRFIREGGGRGDEGIVDVNSEILQ